MAGKPGLLGGWRAGLSWWCGSPGLTGLLDLAGWPKGIRVVARKERPYPGAQLWFTDVGGQRIAGFAASAKTRQLADLELRHRQRAWCEDRISNAEGSGLRDLPLRGYGQIQIWCQIVALACDLLAWTRRLALTGTARCREPERLRLRLFCAAGRITRGARRLRLRLAARWPWAIQIATSHRAPLKTAGQPQPRPALQDQEKSGWRALSRDLADVKQRCQYR